MVVYSWLVYMPWKWSFRPIWRISSKPWLSTLGFYQPWFLTRKKLVSLSDDQWILALKIINWFMGTLTLTYERTLKYLMTSRDILGYRRNIVEQTVIRPFVVHIKKHKPHGQRVEDRWTLMRNKLNGYMLITNYKA